MTLLQNINSLFPARKNTRRLWVLLFLICCLSLLMFSCTPKPSTKAETPKGFGESRAADLTLVPAATELAVEWSKTRTTQVEVSWLASQKYPVQIAPAAGTPDWLKVETRPVILDPPGTMDIDITADVRSGSLGKHRVTFEASAYGLSRPVTFDIMIDVQRQTGDFALCVPTRQTHECRNICGKVKDGVVTFYDVLRERDQECGEAALPDDQRIGLRVFALDASNGFGFGHGCSVAGVYESAGTLSVVNLGFLDLPIKRGEALLTLPSVQSCWFSPDNTIAVIQSGRGYAPYDLLTGRQVGDICYPTRDIGRIILSGDKIIAEKCEWVIH